MRIFTQTAGHGCYKPYKLECPECGETNCVGVERLTRITKKKGGKKETKIKATCPSCGERVESNKDVERSRAAKGARPQPATKKIGEDVNGDDVKVVEDLPKTPPRDIGEKLEKEQFLREKRKEHPELSEQELEELYEQSR